MRICALMRTHLCHLRISVLVVFNLDYMRPGRQGDRGLICGRRLIYPSIDDLTPIDPHSDAIVGRGCEGGATSSEVKAACPAHREIVDAHSVTGSPRTPVVVD